MSLPNRAVAVLVVECIFCPLALLALFCRLWSRRIMKLRLCSNDFTAILATVLTVGITSVFLAAIFAGGLGLHLKDVPPNELTTVIKLFVPAQLLWGAANSCVKLSIVDLYTKIFPNPVFHRICYITVALTVCYFVSVLLETFLLCRPVAYNWDKTIPGGSCANLSLAYLFSGITNLLIDALVLLLPMPMLWGLHLPFSKKFGLAGMFGLGSIIWVISLQRILWLRDWDQTDLDYTVELGAIWTTLEPALGVVNACLPTIRPVLRKVFYKDVLASSKTSRKNSNNHSWKKYRTEPFTSRSDSDRNYFLPLNNLQTPAKPQTNAHHLPASDDRRNSDVEGPGSNAIQVTRTWAVENLDDGSHHV